MAFTYSRASFSSTSSSEDSSSSSSPTTPISPASSVSTTPTSPITKLSFTPPASAPAHKRRPTLRLEPPLHPTSFLTSASPSALRSFFSPCSSDEEEEGLDTPAFPPLPNRSRFEPRRRAPRPPWSGVPPFAPTPPLTGRSFGNSAVSPFYMGAPSPIRVAEMHLEASLEALRKIEDGDEGLSVLEEKLKEFGRLMEGIKKRRNVDPVSPPELGIPALRKKDDRFSPPPTSALGNDVFFTPLTSPDMFEIKGRKPPPPSLPSPRTVELRRNTFGEEEIAAMVVPEDEADDEVSDEEVLGVVCTRINGVEMTMI